jgi:5-methylcytosine-specific restriction endonuclease McrA
MGEKRKTRDQRRTMRTGPALDRLFGNRKHRPCAYCGKRLSRQTATFDHVKPLSGGGYDKTKNGAIACRQCNGAKGSKSVEQFKGAPNE